LKNATYQKRQEGSATVFEVTPGVSGKGCSMIILGVFAFLVMVSLVYSGNRLSAVTAFGIPAVLAFLWMRYGDFRPRAHRKARTFRVTAETVEADRQAFKNADIHRLIIKNPLSGGDEVIVSPSMLNPTAGIGTGFRAAAAQICFSLDLETGGKAYMLAGGMDQTTAFGLLSDVARILRRSVQ
jgi:hypothetical protein